MRRVRCPECETRVKVPDDHKRSYIRCTSCDKKIDLDDNDDDDSPRKSYRSPRKKKSQGANEYLAYLPLLLIFPLVTCPCIAFLHRIGGALGLLLGLAVAITGGIKAYLAAKRNGLATLDDLPWIFRRMGIVHLFYQFRYAYLMPKEAGIWVLLEMIGFVVALASGIIGERQTKLANQREAQEMFVQQGGNWPGNQEINNGGNPAPALTGDAALDGILAELESKNEPAVRQAAQKLATMAPNQHQALVARQLAAKLQGADPFTQKAVVVALGRWATANEVPALIQVIENKASWAGNEAVDALGRLGDERAIVPLVQRFRDQGSRARAGNALRQLGPNVEKELLPLLRERDPFLQQETAKLLKDIGTQQSVPALQAMAAENHPFVRQAAQNAIAAINARAK